ncbi:alpha/beta fold hydrolase [Dongia sp.]|uniref:alpha/beta fold hydrolase n=1 Tax=Dongia sp. TaxID=1977262 RepID=UPI00375181B8
MRPHNAAAPPALDGPLARRHRVSADGRGGPVLLMLHGFGTDQSVWSRIVPKLGEEYRVIRFDLAGAGPNAEKTFDPRRYGDIQAHVEDLLLLIDELGLKAFHFVGASVGGMIGALASIEKPALFRNLILLGSSPRYLNDQGYYGGFEEKDLDGLFAAMNADYRNWVSGFAPAAVRGVPDSAAVAEFAQSLFRLRPDIAISSARAIFYSDFRARMPGITAKTSILQMPNDIAVPMEVGDFLNGRIGNSVLEVIDAEGHFPHLSKPAVVYDALRRHLKR